MDPSTPWKRKINEITGLERRLLSLKQKATECETIRAERDILLKQINDLNGMEVQRLLDENEKLMKQNYELKFSIKDVKSCTNSTKQIDSSETINCLQKDIIYLKEQNKNLILVSKERDLLEEENENLKIKIDAGYVLPGPKDRSVTVNELKNQLFKTCNQLRNTLEQNEKLKALLVQSENKMDIFIGKITHLQSQLNYVQAFLEQLSASNLTDLENINTTLDESLKSDLTQRMKIQFLKSSIQDSKELIHLPEKVPVEEETKENHQSGSFESLNFGYCPSFANYKNEDIIFTQKEKEGSTEPVSVQTSYSLEAFINTTCQEKDPMALEKLHEVTQTMCKLHRKVEELKKKARKSRIREIDFYNSNTLRVRQEFLENRRNSIKQLES